MANKNGWGDGASNNTIGWGQGANNYIGWGSSELVSYEGLTNIVGAFTTKWTTTANSEQIALPYTGTGTYSGTIYWGDGSTDVNDGTVTTHTYATAGTYMVIITGDCIGWDMLSTIGGSTYWTSVVNWGQLQLGASNFGYNFASCPNLDLSSVQGTLNLTGVTNLDGLFFDCTSLTTINNINSWDTSSITTMSEMFGSCSAFNQPLTFNTSAVTNMANMFNSCSLFNQTLTFNTSAVTNMANMFSSCSLFNQTLTFNTSAVTNMSSMFTLCSVFNQAITFDTSAVTDMSSMFRAATAFNQPLSFDTSSVTDMSSMFRACAVFNQPLTFDTSAVTTMGRMFRDATAFNQNISSFNTGAVTSMYQMFKDATAFNQNIGTWNVANVTNMANMFSGCSAFNQALSFNTSAVTDMAEMFFQCTSFNQALSFNTSAVQFMNGMFYGATAFNQNIGTWNVANVSDFSSFMGDKTPATFSTTNLNAIYNGWSTQSVQSSLTIDFGTAKYTAAATAGRLVLTGTALWTITDGGL